MKKKWTDEVLDDIAERRGHGHTWRAIAKYYNTTPKSIQRTYLKLRDKMPVFGKAGRHVLGTSLNDELYVKAVKLADMRGFTLSGLLRVLVEEAVVREAQSERVASTNN